ncbi:hypothetical protein M0657_008366 [Pyricularia oryzae]|nr:hypothetical protein M9X92_008049 [Pyricularia oryzae]KAI7916817.1 hypothetical protein M0657_008366 [Pyricularia oryzae]
MYRGLCPIIYTNPSGQHVYVVLAAVPFPAIRIAPWEQQCDGSGALKARESMAIMIQGKWTAASEPIVTTR